MRSSAPSPKWTSTASRRNPPGRTPALRGSWRQPHADPRSVVGAGAGGLRPHHPAPRHRRRAQDQARDHRDDHRLGSDRKHGRPHRRDHAARRPSIAGLTQPDGRVRRRPYRAPDGILRRQHGVSQGDHSAGRHRSDVQPDRHAVHPHARGSRGDDDAGQPGPAFGGRPPGHHRRAAGRRSRSGRTSGAGAHAGSGGTCRAAWRLSGWPAKEGIAERETPDRLADGTGRGRDARRSRRDDKRYGRKMNVSDDNQHRGRHTGAETARRQRAIRRPSGRQGAEGRGRRHDLHPVRRPYHRHLRRLHR